MNSAWELGEASMEEIVIILHFHLEVRKDIRAEGAKGPEAWLLC